jgi:hypothetical protein
MSLSPAGQLIFQTAESMDKVLYSMGRLSQQQYFHQAYLQPSTTGRQCRKTRSDGTMARGPRPFSPPARHAHWGFQSNGTYTAYTIFMHLSNRDFPVFGDICRQVVNIDDEDLNWSRQDTNTLCEEAGMYLNLRDIAAGASKFSWDRMLQDAVLLHSSEDLANTFS